EVTENADPHHAREHVQPAEEEAPPGGFADRHPHAGAEARDDEENYKQNYAGGNRASQRLENCAHDFRLLVWGWGLSRKSLACQRHTAHTGYPRIMPKLAANLSTLFTEQPFLDRFAAAARAGFRGVEYQYPYEHKAEDLAAAARDAGVKVVLHNMPRGEAARGEHGTACLPGRQQRFRDD